MPTFNRTLVCLAAFVLIGGCDSQELRDEFLDDASEPASGFTETTVEGEVVSSDADDWRTAPGYRGVVTVDPAFPNPPNGATVTINVTVQHQGGVQGALQLVTLDTQGDPQVLDEITDADMPFIYSFRFPATLLAQDGLVRVYIYDTVAVTGSLLSYGDIQL